MAGTQQYNSNNTIIMVISNVHDAEKRMIEKAGQDEKNWRHIAFTGMNFTKDIGTGCNFILVNQDRWDECKDEVTNTLCISSKSLMVWSHASGGPNCSDFNKKLSCKRFNHITNEQILAFMDIISKDPTKYDTEANRLILKNIDYHRMRAEILSPLMQLHICLQQCQNEDDIPSLVQLAKNYYMSSQSPDKAFAGLIDLKSVATEVKGQLSGQFALIKRSTSTDKEALLKSIEKFAANLDSIVNYIEFDEPVNLS